MSKKYCFCIYCLFFLLPFGEFSTIFAQHDNSLDGYWKGKLKLLNGDSLSLLLIISSQNDSTIAFLDSPDQYATDIPIDFFSFQNDSLSFKVSSIFASYSGLYNRESDEIIGVFKQHSFKRNLTLKRTEHRTLFSRPQEPKPPYPYIEQDITFNNPATNLPWILGTLTLPKYMPHALLILISGSGWQDRDETIRGHKPFKVIADYLTREGYAVFRYDDLPQYFFNKATTNDFADAVSFIIDSLTADERFSTVPLGLLGHSEGGLVAFMTAAADQRVDFLITLSGMADGLKETLLYQLEAIGKKETLFTNDELAATVELSNKIYSAIEKSKTQEKALAKTKKILEQYDDKFTDSQKEKMGLSIENRMATLQMISSPWFFYLFHIQPKTYIKQVYCPVYALFSENDLQVYDLANEAILKRYLPKNKHNKIEIFPSLNHLFQESTTGLPQEYGKIEQTISPLVLESIKKWLSNLEFE